jgi:hypothetical protein
VYTVSINLESISKFTDAKKLINLLSLLINPQLTYKPPGTMNQHEEDHVEPAHDVSPWIEERDLMCILMTGQVVVEIVPEDLTMESSTDVCPFMPLESESESEAVAEYLTNESSTDVCPFMPLESESESEAVAEDLTKESSTDVCPFMPLESESESEAVTTEDLTKESSTDVCPFMPLEDTSRGDIMTGQVEDSHEAVAEDRTTEPHSNDGCPCEGEIGDHNRHAEYSCQQGDREPNVECDNISFLSFVYEHAPRPTPNKLQRFFMNLRINNKVGPKVGR